MEREYLPGLIAAGVGGVLLCLAGLTGCGGDIIGDDDGGPNLDDWDDPTATITVCGSGAQYTTISEAVAAAPDGARITVCAGTYPERIAVGGKTLWIEGAGAASTTIDAGGGGTAITIDRADVALVGLTITGGRSAAAGGAILCSGGTLALTGSTVRDSRAEAGGGGIHASSCEVGVDASRFEGNEGRELGGAIAAVDSTGFINDSQFTNNSADYGGAVHLTDGDIDIRGSTFTSNEARVRGGALYQQSDSTVENSVFDRNHSGWTGGAVHVNQHAPMFTGSQFTNNRTEWEGGGFYIHQSQTVLTDSTVRGNVSVDDGGGLRIFESAARLERNVIAENKAEDGDGGGFKCSHVASTFIDNMIVDNWALGAGGGGELDNDSSVLRGGVVSGNHASIGGGLHVMLWPWNGGVIEDVAIVDNEAWRGGGIYFENSFQPVTVRRVLVSGNDAHYGGGVYTRGTRLAMSNSAVYNNEASQGGGFFVHSSHAYPWTRACPCPPIDPAADVSFVVVSGNTADETGSAVWVNAPNITFRNSIFSGHTGTAVNVAPPPNELLPPAPGWRYNDTVPATFAGMADPTGSNGNFSSNPGFANAAGGDFHLTGGSPCINAAEPGMNDVDGTRADLGVFGGPAPMVLD